MHNQKVIVAFFTCLLFIIASPSVSAQKPSTASPNVSIVDSSFWIPQLNRYRKIWIYLPADYFKTKQKYPVIYLLDGQNIFDQSSAYAGEWGVDEFLDSTMLQQSIIVAIENGGEKRINEYSPYDMEKYGPGEGKHYTTFLAKTVKPYIDRNYRTKRNKKNTAIAGSSMGALLSMYAVLQYPRVFGAAGIFSPAFWIAPALYTDIDKKGKRMKAKIYFYAGKQESVTMVPLVLKAFQQLNRISKATMELVIRHEGQHNEASWKKEFPLFYEWLYQ